MNDREFIAKLEDAISRRVGDPGVFRNVNCEVCGDVIPLYVGPNPGVVCSSCYEITHFHCTKVVPLCILRSAIQECTPPPSFWSFPFSEEPDSAIRRSVDYAEQHLEKKPEVPK